MSRRFIFIISVFFFISCGKEDLSSSAPSLIGNWIHYRSSTEAELIKINEEGVGKVLWYDGLSLERETKEKTWKIQDNRMYLGTVTFNLKPYDINEYPKTSSITVIEGYDTLFQGLRYIQLNNQYYREIE